jgi:hypothetical protein
VRAGLAALLPGLVEGPVVDVSPVLLGETVLRLAGALAGDGDTLIVWRIFIGRAPTRWR